MLATEPLVSMSGPPGDRRVVTQSCREWLQHAALADQRAAEKIFVVLGWSSNEGATL